MPFLTASILCGGAVQFLFPIGAALTGGGLLLVVLAAGSARYLGVEVQFLLRHGDHVHILSHGSAVSSLLAAAMFQLDPLLGCGVGSWWPLLLLLFCPILGR